MPTTITQQDYDLAKQFITADVARELELGRASNDAVRSAHLVSARVPVGGGNFLAALGLLCFTEYCGWLRYDNRFPPGHRRAGQPISTTNFNQYFDAIGPAYAAFRATPHNVYDTFRCGMAHEYLVKRGGGEFTIAMLDAANAPMGITYQAGPPGLYTFVVERYYADLVASFAQLDAHLAGQFPLTRP